MSLDEPTSGTRTEARIVAENVTTGYGNHTVLHDVSIASHDDITCIFGPNGSGKSTLLKALAGLVPVWSGRVTYRDRDITTDSPNEIVKAGIATLPQGGGLFPSLTIEENLRLGGHPVAPDDMQARIEGVYEAFPALRGKQNAKAKSLSGGQQMMLGYGCAMMTDADVYLLDEPTAGLAPSLVDDVIRMTETLVERGAQVFLVEQNVTAGLKVADHVYIIAQGEIRFDGTPAELGDEGDLIEVYLGID